MDRGKLERNLGKITKLVRKRQEKFADFYKGVHKNGAYRKVIEGFLERNGIEKNDESRLAVAVRIASLHSSSLRNCLDGMGLDEGKKRAVLDDSYVLVSELHFRAQDELISEVEKKGLLSEFYLEVLKGMHEIGKVFDEWNLVWERTVRDANEKLSEMFDGDNRKIFSYLSSNGLLDKGHGGDVADRSYSVLVAGRSGFRVKPYAKAFPSYVGRVVSLLDGLAERLSSLQDEVYGQRDEFVTYFRALSAAFAEGRRDRLVKRWADAERAWMRITAPIQPGHPFENYSDNFRKAVSLEWDVRLKDMSSFESKRLELVSDMFERLFDLFDRDRYADAYRYSRENLERMQLYVGDQMLYYGSYYTSRWAAQVLPNDTVVSAEMGKKVFSYRDMVLASRRDSPITRLAAEVFEDEFLRLRYRPYLYAEDEKWVRVNDVLTTGHEFGHAIWLAPDAEVRMDVHGDFANVEEFKATCGGLMSFFLHVEEDIVREVMWDHLVRCVGLLRAVDDVSLRPYYCEAIVHLSGLFETGYVSIVDGRLRVDDSPEVFKRVKKWYMTTYTRLVQHYLAKGDATEFVEFFAVREKGRVLPAKEEVRRFAQRYMELCGQYGNVADESDKKENYVKKG